MRKNNRDSGSGGNVRGMTSAATFQILSFDLDGIRLEVKEGCGESLRTWKTEVLFCYSRCSGGTMTFQTCLFVMTPNQYD